MIEKRSSPGELRLTNAWDITLMVVLGTVKRANGNKVYSVLHLKKDGSHSVNYYHELDAWSITLRCK